MARSLLSTEHLLRSASPVSPSIVTQSLKTSHRSRIPALSIFCLKKTEAQRGLGAYPKSQSLLVAELSPELRFPWPILRLEQGD